MFARTITRNTTSLKRITCRPNDLHFWRPLGIGSPSSFSTTRRQDAPGVVRKRPGSFATARFSHMEVPPLAFWKDMSRPPLVTGLDPEDCFKAAHAYVDLAVEDRPGWRNTLRDPPNSLSYATLHYLAVMIMASAAGPAFNIALHIYHTLTTLNYSPAVLTMTRLAFMRNKLGESQFSVAEEKFAALVRRKDDPNACTLQGMILADKLTPETDKQALDWFRIAASLGGEEPGAWDWQTSCALEMGKVYLRLKDRQRAKEIWRYCGETLDAAEGAWLYSTLLDDSDPEKYHWVQRAAISGVQEAAREMARLKGIDAETKDTKGTRTWEQKSASIMQKEWEAIAGDRAIV